MFKFSLKQTLSFLLSVILLLSLPVPARAAEASLPVASNTVTLNSASGNQSELVSYTPETDGTLTVRLAESTLGWAFQVYFSDGSATRLMTGKTAATYEYNIAAGQSCQVELYAYDKANWTFGDGEITYEITFLPTALDEEVVKDRYAVSDSVLALGSNALTMVPTAVNTIFSFTPDQTGTYRFTAGDANALLGYWGSSAHYLMDSTADKSNTLECTITSVGQRVMLGIAGVDRCDLTVERIADYNEVIIPTIVYENTHTFGSYSYDQDALVEIDLFDGNSHSAVLGEDGFYRYGCSTGPVMVVNLKTAPININSVYTYRQLTCYGTDETGAKVKYDYNDALMAYYNQGLYPVTEELGMMLQQVGLHRGWYKAGGFIYPDATEVDEEIGWIGLCSYVRGTEITGSVSLSLAYPTLAFEDEIRYNIYFTASDTTSIVEMGLMTLASRDEAAIIDDALEVIPGYVTNSNGTYTVSTNGIPAKMLGDMLYFKVYAQLSDGSYVYSDVAGYNAKLYAADVLESNASDSSKSLMVAMLNYGTAAQLYFNYNTDALMNAALTAEQQALVEAYSTSMVSNIIKVNPAKAGNFVNNGGFATIYPRVSFEGAFSINYYFTPAHTPDGAVTFYYWTEADYKKISVLKPQNATGTVEMTSDTGVYTATVSGIAAKAIDAAVYVAAVYTSGGTTYITNPLHYSLGTYCKEIAAEGSDFGAATAVYGYYAKAYFA